MSDFQKADALSVILTSLVYLACVVAAGLVWHRNDAVLFALGSLGVSYFGAMASFTEISRLLTLILWGAAILLAVFAGIALL